jgi:hypothetical protein
LGGGRGHVTNRALVDPFLGHPLVGPPTVGVGITGRSRATAPLIDLGGALLRCGQGLVEFLAPFRRELVSPARTTIR